MRLAKDLGTRWLVRIERRVVETDVLVIGSRIRGSKILLPDDLLSDLSNSRVIDDLATSSSPPR